MMNERNGANRNPTWRDKQKHHTNTRRVRHDDFKRSSTRGCLVDTDNQFGKVLEKYPLNFNGISLKHGSGLATSDPHTNPKNCMQKVIKKKHTMTQNT